MKHCIKIILGVAVLLLNLFVGPVLAQVRVGVGAGQATEPTATVDDLLNYASPKDYEIAGLTVTGTRYLDPNSLVSLAGLKVGDKIRIPGEAVGSAVRKLMDSGLLDNVEMFATTVVDNKVSLMFRVLERPRLYKVSFLGIKKGEQDQLKDKVKLNLGKIVTNTITKNTQMAVRKFFIDKGYLNTKVKITTVPDSARNNATMRVLVDKGQKVKIAKITFDGRTEVDESAVRMKMKNTKEMRFGRLFSPSKFVPKKYEEDKQKLITYYNKLGYRDALIEHDTIIHTGANTIKLNLAVNEGRRYYYRNVDFSGNYLYKADQLREVLGIKKGDVYDPEDLDKRLNGNPGQDLSSQYMDIGYLYYNAQPIEKSIDGDSIDLEIRIFEGKQATINRVMLNGNTKTSDHVVMRTVRTLPGQKFSKTNLIRTQRELSTLGYFDPEKIGITPIPQNDGTVDIEYTVEEKPSDQIELSGGWGGYVGFVGTLGLTFNNFSARNIGNRSAWRPLPSGDGQRVQLRFQANGAQYQVYSLSFTEPWLGGRKPNALSVSASHTVYQTFIDYNNPNYNPYQSLKGRKPTGSYTNTAFTVGLGRQLKVPDDFFSLTNSISFQRYDLNNLDIFQIGYSNGVSNNFTFNTTLSRNSIDSPQFPRSGSSFTLSGSFTPPYSAFRKVSIESEKPEDKYKFVEYHKWMFDASWFQTVFGKLVLSTRAHMGFLGSYNSRTSIGPFERFVLGGSGLAGQGQFALAQDIIGLRGYDDRSVYTADYDRTSTQQERSRGGVVYNKFVAELRYPVSLNPSATIFVLTFLEAGNNWSSYKQYNPFDLKRSVGFGARIFMPAFGLIGIDYGYGFDKIPGVKDKASGQFHFTIGQQFR